MVVRNILKEEGSATLNEGEERINRKEKSEEGKEKKARAGSRWQVTAVHDNESDKE